MIWLTWRQHRHAVAFAAASVAVSALVLVVYGLHVRGVYDAAGVRACLAGSDSVCHSVRNDFVGRFHTFADEVMPLLSLAVGAVGAFAGGPLVAREYEQGTSRLVWAQSVSRSRWLLIQVGVLLGGLVVFTLALSAIVGWYRAPLDAVEGRFGSGAFDAEGVVLTGYAMFSFALGVLAGLALRRVVAAVTVAALGLLVIRLPVEFWLRPHYQPPVTTLTPAGRPFSPARADWQLGSGYADPSGHHLSAAQTHQLTNTDLKGASLTTYLQQHHLRLWQSYQPASRFWSFQFTELAIFMGLTVLALAAAVWWLHHDGL